jgi:Fe(3+) dicitrate transport protein
MRWGLKWAVAACVACLFSVQSFAQQGGAAAPTPAPGASELPPVEVIQKKAAPAPKAAAKAASKKKQAVAPAPQPPPPEVAATPGPERFSDGRVVSSAPSINPIDPTSGIVPADLQDYAGAASRVTTQDIELLHPLNNHEALASVPGVVAITDDGLARHSGIGIRGSNFRRSRKVLVMEDGQSINLSTYLDPSVHYTPPTDRVESIEVVRGTVVAHGPLNNHGIINFQNLSPFGEEGTVIKGALSFTDDVNKDVGNYRHVRTRQHAGNVGVVAAYSGADAAGAWDNEVLRYDDFYGAIGWRDSAQDLTLSGVYFRQRDNYDEDNFVGTVEDFFANGRRKSGNDDFGDGATDVNTYNADYYRLQLAHNLYIDENTTLSTRAYLHDHERNRFSAREAFDPPGTDPDDLEFHMRGRERHYRYYGVDSRIEFANVPLVGGIRQDIQAGARYERHSLRNCTSFGEFGQILNDDTKGNCRAVSEDEGGEDPDDGEIEKYEADSFAAFIQSAIHLTPSLTVTPGVRFESYDVTGRIVFPDTEKATSEHDHVLPGIAFAWEALDRTTVYGGYHRGFAPHIARDAGLDAFPLDEEVGDNFQIGVRSTAVKGVTFDAAYFHSFIDEYQLKESYSSSSGDGIFGTLDEVEINGVELAARLESRPYTGGPWNLFGEAAYTYTNGKINRGEDALFEDLPLLDVSGNRLPFAIEHFANLTVGVAYKKFWDASMTWTYRGDFFTNPQNTGPLLCVEEDEDPPEVHLGCGDGDELVGGRVDDVWLLSARTNINVTEQLSLFLAGSNLTNEFYIAELSDGAKPGLGRTIYGGFTLKFD